MEKIFEYNGFKIFFSEYCNDFSIKSQGNDRTEMSSTALKSFNPVMYEEVMNILPGKVEEYKKWVKEQEEIERQKKIKEVKEKTDSLSKEVGLYCSDSVSVESVTFNTFTLSLDGERVSASFNDQIYDSSYRVSHKSDKPWKIEHGYKFVTRKETVENAVKYMIKKLCELKEINDNIKKVETEKSNRINSIKEKIESSGLTFVADSHGYYSKGDHGRYISYPVYKASMRISKDVVVSGGLDYDGDKIQNPVILGKLTIDQFKKLVEFVKTLEIK